MGDYKAGNLKGTLKDNFEVGDGAEYGIDRVGDHLRVKDVEMGAQRISDLMGWHLVESGQTRTVPANFTHTVSDITIEEGGTLVIEEGGVLAIL